MAPPRKCECGDCPICRRREYIREWYRSKPPKWTRERNQKNQAARRASRRRDYQKHRAARVAALQGRDPVKLRATKALNSAVARGLIKREPCEVCGEQRSEGHHDDYSKPFDVRWLCRQHHVDLHWQLRYGDAA